MRFSHDFVFAIAETVLHLGNENFLNFKILFGDSILRKIARRWMMNKIMKLLSLNYHLCQLTSNFIWWCLLRKLWDFGFSFICVRTTRLPLPSLSPANSLLHLSLLHFSTSHIMLFPFVVQSFPISLASSSDLSLCIIPTF